MVAGSSALQQTLGRNKQGQEAKPLPESSAGQTPESSREKTGGLKERC